jgi:ribosomal protein L37AE/L43A
MPEHYTKNTVSATYWCPKCAKPTLHRVDSGRRGPCLVCLEKPLAAQAPKPEDLQGDLFGGK